MKLSTRGRYSVRLMFELALNGKGQTVYLKDVAQRQELSEKYMSKLVIPLRGAGLIVSVRGAHGGYMLGREPEDITIREIVEVAEGSLSLVECVQNSQSCDRTRECPTRNLWCRLEKHMVSFLEGITLQDLVDEYDSASGQDSLMYHI